MAGKSVYLRQTGHIVVLAQIGAFVPARSARIGLVDRVFTRVGAQDNLARGQSHVPGRDGGDGLDPHTTSRRAAWCCWTRSGAARPRSTAWPSPGRWWKSCTTAPRGPRCSSRPTSTSSPSWPARLGGVRNFHVAVREWNDEIVFLHKVQPGGTDRSLRHPGRAAGRSADRGDRAGQGAAGAVRGAGPGHDRRRRRRAARSLRAGRRRPAGRRSWRASTWPTSRRSRRSICLRSGNSVFGA